MYNPTGIPVVPAAQPSPSDLAALRNVQLASLLGLCGFALSLALLGGFALVYGGWEANGVLSLAGAESVAAIAIVGLALAVVAMWLYWGAFRSLRSTDPGFARPALLALLAMGGMILVLLGVAVAAAEVASASACAASNPFGLPVEVQIANCLSGQSGVAPYTLLILGAILWFFGLVGVLFGARRLGQRYASRQIRVAALLQLVPFVGAFGTLVIFLNASRLKRGSAQGGPFEARPGFAPGALPPPPPPPPVVPPPPRT